MASESRPTFVRRSTAESDKTGARMNHSLIKFQFLFILFRNSIFEAQVKIVFNRADDNDSSFFFFFNMVQYNRTLHDCYPSVCATSGSFFHHRAHMVSQV